MPPPAVQPLRVWLSWWPVVVGVTVFHSEASIFAHAPPPVTSSRVLSVHVKPSRPRAVTNQRSWVSEIQVGRPSSNPWPDLLTAEPSPSTPSTHAPNCQLQPSWPPPMKPDRSKLLVPRPTTSPSKCSLEPFEVPALAPT